MRTTPTTQKGAMNAGRTPVKRTSIRDRWQATARNRLRLELAGLAFAIKHGHAPEEYAREIWGRGALGFMGKNNPKALEYLLKEARALSNFYPWVKLSVRKVAASRAEMTIFDGCLAGWGEDRWAVARGLGLTRDEVCRYCNEAFRVWGEQLGLAVSLEAQPDDTCVLSAANKE